MDLEALFLIGLEFVRYQSYDSEYKNVTCSVPQGSILGPHLFILYVNDITNTTSLFKIILFADDTTLLYSHPDISSKISSINMELSEISNWFKENKLSVNGSKTNYMIFWYFTYNNKYIDVNEYCHDDDMNINCTISIAFHNKER